MTLSRRRPTIALVLVCLAVLAGACGTDTSGTADPDGPDIEGGSAGSGGTSTGPAPDPSYGGRVVYGLEAETSGGFCLPEAQLAISGIQVARTIYDTLTAPDENGEYVPFLAESITPNDDFTEWTITIRNGIVFHDGTALDAQVVANNLDAYRGAYEGRSPLLFLLVFALVSDVEVVDDMTVVVHVADSWPALPAYLFASGRLGIMAQAQLDSDDCTRDMIGTGPFELESWQIDDRLVARRNPSYWRVDESGNQLPYLDEIEYRPIADSTQMMNMLEAHEIQVIHTSSPFSIDRLRQWRDDARANLVESDAFAEVGYLMLNTSTAPFDSETARLAVAHAIDRDELNEVRGLGIPTVATGPFAPGNMGHLEETPYPEFDPELAAELVAEDEATSAEPFVFNMIGTPDPELVASADMIQSMLEDVGITVRRQRMEQAQLINTALGGSFEMILWRNHPGGDPDEQYVWWRSGYPTNFGRITDPDIDELLDRGRHTTDLDERPAIYEELNRVMAERAYNLWMVWVTWAVATAPGVHGVTGPPLPDGSAPSPGLGTGHSVTGMWIES